MNIDCTDRRYHLMTSLHKYLVINSLNKTFRTSCECAVLYCMPLLPVPWSHGLKRTHNNATEIFYRINWNWLCSPAAYIRESRNLCDFKEGCYLLLGITR